MNHKILKISTQCQNNSNRKKILTYKSKTKVLMSHPSISQPSNHGSKENTSLEQNIEEIKIQELE